MRPQTAQKVGGSSQHGHRCDTRALRALRRERREEDIPWRAARSSSAPYSNGYALRLVVGAMARSRLVLACNGKFIYSKFAHRDPVPIEPLRFMRGALLETRPPWWPAQTTTQAGEGPERRQQVEPVWSCKASAFYALDLLCVPLCSR